MRRRVRIGKAFDLEVLVDNHSPEPEKREKEKTSPRQVKVGKEFDAKVSFPKEGGILTDADIRSRMVWAVFAMIALFLFGAAGLGLYKGEFSSLQAIWTVAGPIYGGIASYFFTRQARK